MSIWAPMDWSDAVTIRLETKELIQRPLADFFYHQNLRYDDNISRV